MYVIGVLGQKGGTGKSTISRLLAVQFAIHGWSTGIADMDSGQATCLRWAHRRQQAGHEPAVWAEAFNSAQRAVKTVTGTDLLVIDGMPFASRTTSDIADVSDWLILPVGTAVDDLEPTVRLLNELHASGWDRDRLRVVFSRVKPSRAELEAGRQYIAQAGYKAFETAIPEKTGYSEALDVGKAPGETRFASLNAVAQSFTREIAIMLKNA